jgi:peptide/nickel transport system permease protein
MSDFMVKKIQNSFLFLYLRNKPLQAFGLAVTIFSIFMVLFGQYIIPHSATVGTSGEQLLPPSLKYLFGTDINGMDVFSRTIAAYKTDLSIVLAGALLALCVGFPAGVFAGYFDGRKGFSGVLSILLLRFMDVLQSFPIFVLGLLFVAIFGPSPRNLIVLIGIANIPGNLRLARSEVITLREKNFVEAARAAGNSEMRIAFVQVAPNAMAPVIALLSVVMGFGILLIAGLSFIGAGVRAPTPEWGSMIASGGLNMITGQWWPSIFPGIFMALTVFGFSMVGEIITALIDPLERINFQNSREL